MPIFSHLAFIWLCFNCSPSTTNAIRFGISHYLNESATTATTPATTTTESSPTATSSETTTLLVEDWQDDAGGQDNLNIEQLLNKLSTTTPTTVSYTTNTPTIIQPVTKKPKTIIVKKTTSTTLPPTTTTTTITPTSEEELLKNNISMENNELLLNKYKSFCFCDFSWSLCDVNCCCDADCATEVLKVFDCYAQPQYAEFHNRLEDFHYQHGLPSCRVNDGWLCVFRTNTKNIVQPVKTYTMMSTSQFYKWPHALPQLGESILFNSSPVADTNIPVHYFYRYDAQILLLNMKTMEMQVLEFPATLGGTSICHIQKPVRHLRANQQSNCHFEKLSTLNSQTNAIVKMANECKLLRQPNSHINMDNRNEFSQQLGDIIVRNCTKDEKANVHCTIFNTTLPILGDSTKVYIHQIQLQLFHNYTHILSSIIDFFPKNYTVIRELWQSYQVQFIPIDAKNHTESNNMTEFDNDIHIREENMLASGPLGYLLGKPLIVAHYIEIYHHTDDDDDDDDNSDNERISHKILDYFQANVTRLQRSHTLQLPRKKNGICLIKNDTVSISYMTYGVNSYSSCTMQFDMEESASSLSSNTTNFTAICQRLQAQAWSILYSTPKPISQSTTTTIPLAGSTLYISRLGHPQNHSNQWLPLQIHNTDFPIATAEYFHDRESFVCRNILLSVNYEFQIDTTSSVLGIPMQAQVLEANLNLGPRHDIEFGLNEIIEVPISIAVMFYNVGELANNDATNPCPSFIVVFLPYTVFHFLSSFFPKHNL